jgi:hypothetical protein
MATIHIEDDEKYRKKGLSKIMIKYLLENIRKNSNIKDLDDRLVFIGADSSEGFWEKIGFMKNPYIDDGTKEQGRGFELVTTFKTLEDFVATTIIETPTKSKMITRSKKPKAKGSRYKTKGRKGRGRGKSRGKSRGRHQNYLK